jgi:putative FmdB family regulatory protein
MPIYATRCKTCQAESSVYRRVAERNNLSNCDCGGEVERIISAPYVRGDITPYISPATGRVINSRAQMQYDLDVSGKMIDEPGLSKDIARRKDEKREEIFAPVAAGIDQTVRALVNNGQIESL